MPKPEKKTFWMRREYRARKDINADLDGRFGGQSFERPAWMQPPLTSRGPQGSVVDTKENPNRSTGTV